MLWSPLVWEQVRLCAVWPVDNWLGSSLSQIQGPRVRPLSENPTLAGHLVGGSRFAFVASAAAAAAAKCTRPRMRRPSSPARHESICPSNLVVVRCRRFPFVRRSSIQEGAISI